MGGLIDERYKLSVTIDRKKQIGFHYDYELDDYVYAFGCYDYNHTPIIICKIVVDESTDNVTINVYDSNGQTYVPYYQGDKRNRVLPVVENNIRKELYRIGAKPRRRRR